MHKKNWISVFYLAFVLPSLLLGQAAKDQVLFRVNNQPVMVDEFLAVFRKNNPNPNKPTEYEVREYLDLFTKFKMKVASAYAQGLDTMPTYKSELAMYRRQLAQPYLTDKETSEKLLNEAYERLKKEVSASHILIRVSEDATPKDTLEAFNKLVALRNRVIKGEDFGKLAREFSEDPSAKENSGNLGYFSVLRMIYPFENMAYQTEINKISPVFRTQFGYHILKVNDIRDNRGEVRVAHLMIVSRENDSESARIDAKQRILEIHRKATSGEKWDDLVTQFSEDQQSAAMGGELPWFGTGRMVPEFEAAAFALKENGAISAPVKTPFGYHIIKRLEARPIASFKDSKTELEQKIARDSRSNLNVTSFVAKLKKEYNFVENGKNKTALFKAVDTSLLSGTWRADRVSKFVDPLFTLGGKTFYQNEFSSFLESYQPAAQQADLMLTIQKIYDQFVEKSVIDFEDSRLEIKYPDFKNLMREYREGILLFELTDREVWSKAIIDTAGLQAFYEKNKNKHLWNTRVDATLYHCLDQKVAQSVRKMAKNKKTTNEQIATTINKTNPLNVKIQDGKFEKTAHPVLEQAPWKTGVSAVFPVNNGFSLVKIRQVLPSEPKLLQEIKGLMTSEYQNYLEKTWLESLQATYKITVNEEILKQLYQ